ncbi:hypothetical protein GGR57DRAFT_123375 [Xylariaceae sp. FL1272]|nr:hypothetical protein GGR57DRAFT_123375 [Xylariaceae sp. FL1272]
MFSHHRVVSLRTTLNLFPLRISISFCLVVVWPVGLSVATTVPPNISCSRSPDLRGWSLAISYCYNAHSALISRYCQLVGGQVARWIKCNRLTADQEPCGRALTQGAILGPFVSPRP